MKTYVFRYWTNYGERVKIVNACSVDLVKTIAEKDGVWDGYGVEELDAATEGVVFTGGGVTND